jgi:hypothetical protein
VGPAPVLRSTRIIAAALAAAVILVCAPLAAHASVPKGRVGIGDSIMLSVKPALTDLGWAGVHARVGRPFHDGLAVAQRLADEGLLAKRVIVGLATNGPLDPADCDTLVSIVGSSRWLFLITAKVPRSWQDGNNHALNRCARTYPKVDVIRWWGYSHRHPRWFAADRYHLSSLGQERYVAFVDAQVTAILAGG